MGMPGLHHHRMYSKARRAPLAEAGAAAGTAPTGAAPSRRASFTGLFVLLAASTMVFAAFTSAFVVRRGLSNDWVYHARCRPSCW